MVVIGVIEESILIPNLAEWTSSIDKESSWCVLGSTWTEIASGNREVANNSNAYARLSRRSLARGFAAADGSRAAGDAAVERAWMTAHTAGLGRSVRPISCFQVPYLVLVPFNLSVFRYDRRNAA